MNKRYHFVFACFRQVVTFFQIILIAGAISLATLPPVSTMLSNGTPSSKFNAALINVMSEILQPLQWFGGAPTIAKAAPPAQMVVTVGLQGRGIALLPEIDISSLDIDFGDVELGDVVTRTLTIRNLGNTPLLMTSLSLGGANVLEFSALNGTCGLVSVSLAAGASCTINLTFHPSLLGGLTTTLSIVSNDLDELLTLVDLSGTGIPVPAPEIAVSVLDIDFGDVELGDVVTRTLTISNLGNAPLLMTSLSLGGADVLEFSALDGSCGLLSVSLAAGASCTIDLTFHPSALGVLTTTLSIVSNDLDELLTLIDLLGTGIPVPDPEIVVSPANLDFGAVDVGEVATRTLTISNTGNAPLLVSSIAISGTNALEFTVVGGTCGALVTTVMPGQSCNVQIAFHPLTDGTKNAELVILNNDMTEPRVRIAFIASSSSTIPGELSIQLDALIAGDNIVNREEAPAVLIAGQTQPGVNVELALDDGVNPALKATTTADRVGNYQATLDIRTLHKGTIAVRATAIDVDSRRSAQAVKQILKDTIVLAPVMISPANGTVILAQPLLITGTGEVGGVVSLLIQGQTLTSTVDINGVWQVLVAELAEQAHVVRLKITDVAGNSTAFIDGNTFTVDIDRTTIPDPDARNIYLPLIQK